jgi:beta-lactamase class D
MKNLKTNIYLVIIAICFLALAILINATYNLKAGIKYVPALSYEIVVIDSMEYIQYSIHNKEQAYEGLIPKSTVKHTGE